MCNVCQAGALHRIQFVYGKSGRKKCELNPKSNRDSAVGERAGRDDSGSFEGMPVTFASTNLKE